MTKIAIVGAGISGLSLAFFIKHFRKDISITIYEKSNRIGGWVNSKEKGEFLFETGTQSLHINKQNYEPVNLIIDSLKLERLKSKNLKRFVLDGEDLIELPKIFKANFFKLFNDVFLHSKEKKFSRDMSIKEFFDVVGSRNPDLNKIVRLSLGTFVNGLYGGDYSRWNMYMFSSYLYELIHLFYSSKAQFLSKILPSNSGKSFDKNKLGTFSFPKGLSQLTTGLHQYLVKNEVLFKMNQKVTSIGKNSLTIGPESENFDTVVSCAPAYSLKEMSNYDIDMDFSNLVVVNLGFDNSFLHKCEVKESAGFLVAPNADAPFKTLLGVSFDSFLFPQKNQNFVVNVISRYDPLLKDNEILGNAIEMISKYFILSSTRKNLEFIKGHLKEHEISIMNRGIPQYNRYVDWSNIGLRFPAIGASFSGISLGSCIQSSYELASTLIQD